VDDGNAAVFLPNRKTEAVDTVDRLHLREQVGVARADAAVRSK
jgi:hypothetical protein